MSVDRDVHLPPASAAVAQNPAEQIQQVEEAAVEKHNAPEVTVDDGAVDPAKKKKPEAGLGNYFVSLSPIPHLGPFMVLMRRSESLPMAPSSTPCS